MPPTPRPAGRLETFAALSGRLIDIHRPQKTLLVGIDGARRAGKTRFAERLATALTARDVPVHVVRMDEFYHPSARRLAPSPTPRLAGDEYDWKRLIVQLLAPLRHDRQASYQRYDRRADTLAAWHTISPGGCVIVEGLYALHPELAGLYDVRIRVECPRDIRLARDLENEGENVRMLWDAERTAEEDEYMRTFAPAGRADLRVDGSGLSGLDSGTEFLLLEE